MTKESTALEAVPDVDAVTDAVELQEAAAPSPQDAQPAFVSIFPQGPLDPEFANAVEALELVLKMPVYLLVQAHGHHPFAAIDEPVRAGFFMARGELKKCEKVALVIDSPGGQAKAAYQIATLFRRHAGGFVAVVPRYAKSAATLLTLGADEIYMSVDAELGPLDAQLFDSDREDYSSALDEVQALERLNVAALEQADAAMMMLVQRTGKKVESLLPVAMKYSADMMRPLLENIDTVHYIKQSRILRVAEEYADRLLSRNYNREQSKAIAAHFVNSYPEHGFIIDRDETGDWLNLADATEEQEIAIDRLAEIITQKNITAIGRVTRSSREEGS